MVFSNGNYPNDRGIVSAGNEQQNKPVSRNLFVHSTGTNTTDNYQTTGISSTAERGDVAPFAAGIKNFDPTQGSYQGSARATFKSGQIPTDYNSNPGAGELSDCPGNLTVSIPLGAIITGVDVSYEMTAVNLGFMVDQRSKIICTSSGGEAEPSFTAGSGTSNGTYSYERTGLDIANNVSGGGNISFQLHALRIYGASGDGCGTSHNFVEDESWTITVHYTAPLPFFDDFEAEELSASWSQYVLGSDAQVWRHSTNVFHGGAKSLFHLYNASAHADTWLVSPAVLLPEQNSSLLSFWFRANFYGDYTYTGLWISTGSPDPQDEDYVEVFEFNDIVGSQWLYYDLDLDEYKGQEIHVALVYQGQGGHDFYLDDFRIIENPKINKPVYFNSYPNFYSLEVLDLEALQGQYGLGIPLHTFLRTSTWANGRIYATNNSNLFSIMPDSVMVDIINDGLAFSNGLAYNHFEDEMFLLGGNYGGKVYNIEDYATEGNLVEIGSIPSNKNISAGVFDNQGIFYVVYGNNVTGRLYLGTLNAITAGITEIGDFAEISGTLGSLMYDHTDNVLYYQYNESSQTGRLLILDRETAEATNVSGSPEVSRFAMSMPFSNVYLEVINDATDAPLEEARILFDNHEINTDANGQAMIGLGYGTHDFVVEKDGFMAAGVTVELGYAGSEVSIRLTPTSTLTLDVYHGSNPLPNANVSIEGEQTQTTNSQGRVVFADLTPEIKEYSVAATGYDTKSGTVDLSDGDVSLEVFLDPSSYLVTVEIGPSGAGSVTGTGEYMHGSQVSLSATANEGFTFAHWAEDDDVVFSNSSYTFTINRDRDLKAIFTPNEYDLTVNASPQGAGSVDVNPSQSTYHKGEAISVQAIAEEEYRFVNWKDADGNELSAQSVYNFTMPAADLSLTAHFELTTNLSVHSWQGLEIFPNPARSHINIQGDLLIEMIEVYDILGQLMMSQENPDKDLQLDVSDFKHGMYFLRIYSNGESESHRIFVID